MTGEPRIVALYKRVAEYYGSVDRETYMEFAVRPAILEFVFFWIACAVFLK